MGSSVTFGRVILIHIRGSVRAGPIGTGDSSRPALEKGLNMAAPGFCPDCGSKQPANAPDGLCPHCLLRLGLGAGALGEPERMMTTPDEQPI